MVHLWIGYDHMLFLLALVLPAAVRRESGCWVRRGPARQGGQGRRSDCDRFHDSSPNHLGHCATLGIVRLPVEWVETFISLSIVAAAINIIWPFLGQRR